MKATFYILLGLLCADIADAKGFQFLYIEASEGNSSGGHVAVQLGDEVYHYQYENALIRLFKHKADAFRVDYQLMQNRNIHVADIEVSDSTYDRLSHYFNDSFFAQKQKLKYLQALQQDQALLSALLKLRTGKDSITIEKAELTQPLQGAGLFYSDRNPNSINAISNCDTRSASAKILAEAKRQIQAKYGDNFLQNKINNLRTHINQLAPANDITKSSSRRYSFSENYSDLLNGLLALKALQNHKPLERNACFKINLPELSLSNTDLKLAENLQKGLLQTALSLMITKRPDWGYALFVTMARLVAIEQSIQTRRWTFLDDTDKSTAHIPSQQLTLYAEHIKQQRKDDLERLRETMSEFKKQPTANDRQYTELEIATNRYQQWLLSDKTGMLHYRSEQTLPNKSIGMSQFLSTDLSPTQLELALHQQALARARLLSEDDGHNAYQLVTSNCVTKLFDNIDAALSGQSEQLLGGKINPRLTFIPFQAFEAVNEIYKVVTTRTELAYRKQKLAKMYGREVDSWVYARESNVFSSSLYKHNPDDAWFVFFTDDALLLRPLFGAVNTIAATSQSVWGLLRLPFDEGKEIKIGTRGVLTSLPELAFFNIRKGSYPVPLEH